MRHDVAIYAASSATAGFYDRSHGRAGGAERQMTLLARTLAERGHRVAHVIHAPRDPVELTYPLTLVHRDPHPGGAAVLRPVREAAAVWRALRRADADVVVVRTASPAVGVAALYCRRYRRALVFSSSNISDFTLEKMGGRWNRALYRLGVRLADAVVIQSEDQRELALRPFPSLRRVVRIPSFAEPMAGDVDEPGSAFLWFGRCVAQKQPLLYVELAKAVPEARFTMIPVPEGRDRSLLEELRREGAGVENLELLDPLPHARLAELVARAVAVVNTSTLEGMPNAFLEAWSAGVPVLTLRFDPDGVVARERLGVAAGDSWPRFVSGARELWESRHHRAELARRVRAHVAAEHSPEAAGERWSALLEQVRGGRAAIDGARGRT